MGELENTVQILDENGRSFFRVVLMMVVLSRSLTKFVPTVPPVLFEKNKETFNCSKIGIQDDLSQTG